jgi:cytochrome c-type biogenesis protein CcmH
VRDRGLLAAGLLTAMVTLASAAAPVSEEAVQSVAAQLRCVVCQNLSVADSPSETARQMRDIVRERLAAGDTREQVLAYFVDRYGPWILLSPPRRGFALLVWVAPFAALAAGLGLAAVLVRRWTHPRARLSGETEAVSPVDPATSERIRRELAELGP